MAKETVQSKEVSSWLPVPEDHLHNGASDLQTYMRRRERGWEPRVDAPPTVRTRTVNGRRPQTSRYVKLQRELEQSMFNGTWQYVDTKNVRRRAKPLQTIDLFAGCGGLTLGFEEAGFKSLLAVELDPDAARTYKRNFPDAEVWADRIEDLDCSEIRDVLEGRQLDVLVGGFPCVGFSVAGQRNPKDERNVLFREVVRIARDLQPAFLVLENVPGIFTISKGTVIQAIRDEFGEIGYDNISALILEAAAFGVAQYRPRAIFVANRVGKSNPFPGPLLKSEEYVPIEDAIDDLKTQDRDVATNHDWTHHSPKMEERLSKVEPGGSLYDSYTDAWKRQYRGAPAMTIKENHGAPHIHYELNRTLSAREMARLQGFPDSFLFTGRMKRVMFQIGNAVPVALARHVALAVATAF